MMHPPEFYINELRSGNVFDDRSITKIQQRAQIFKEQGLSIKNELNRMDLVIHGDPNSRNFAATVAAAAKSYHHYLESEGYFDNEPTFTQATRSTDIDEPAYILLRGSIFIEDVSACPVLTNRLTDIWSKNNKVVLIYGVTSQDLPYSLSKITIHPPMRLKTKRVEQGFDRFAYAHTTLLKCFDDRFNGRMKLEGGRNGPHIRLCLRELLKSCGKCADKADIETAVISEFEKTSKRQFKRLAQRKSLTNSDNNLDALFFSADDILGPNPGSATQGHIEEWDKLRQLVGHESVKQSIRSHMQALAFNHYRELNELKPVQVSLSRLFIGPPGTGKTTFAKLYGGILAKLGILSNGELITKIASDFASEYIGESIKKTTKIISEARGNVLLIGEAYMLNPKHYKKHSHCQEVIDTLVSLVTNEPGEDLCVILCGYKQEMEALLQDANPGLRRRFPIEDAFVFDNFTDMQLGQILDLKMKEQQLDLSTDGRECAMRVLKLAKQRPNFGNGGEVVNTISHAVAHLRQRIGTQLDVLDESSRVEAIKQIKLEPVDFDPEYKRMLTATEEIQLQFGDLIGLDVQIDLFRSWASRAENMVKNNVDPKPFIPFAFVIKGPPGCGKTTFARRLGTLYYKMGLLATSEVVDVSTKDLIAGYIGQTALKTRELLEKSLGKVLFIDEAYRLKGHDSHNHSSGSVFAAEARDELIDAMTKPMFLGKIVIILAGYEDYMDDMLAQNPGLRSRFRTQIRFPTLSAVSCVALLKKKVADVGVKISLSRYEKNIESIFEELRQVKGWGNGRDVEDIAKEVVGTIFEQLGNDGERVADGRMVLDTIKRWCALQKIHLSTKESARRDDNAPLGPLKENFHGLRKRSRRDLS
jgi:SpoVK/Ycf46/Vps4 family AAA+-type ATPase